MFARLYLQSGANQLASALGLIAGCSKRSAMRVYEPFTLNDILLPDKLPAAATARMQLTCLARAAKQSKRTNELDNGNGPIWAFRW